MDRFKTLEEAEAYVKRVSEHMPAAKLKIEVTTTAAVALPADVIADRQRKKRKKKSYSNVYNRIRENIPRD